MGRAGRRASVKSRGRSKAILSDSDGSSSVSSGSRSSSRCSSDSRSASSLSPSSCSSNLSHTPLPSSHRRRKHKHHHSQSSTSRTHRQKTHVHHHHHRQHSHKSHSSHRKPIKGSSGSRRSSSSRKPTMSSKPSHFTEHDSIKYRPNDGNSDSSSYYSYRDDSPSLFRIERIMNHRLSRNKNGYELLVKWLNYDEADNTWQPEEECLRFKSAVKKYWDFFGGRPPIYGRQSLNNMSAPPPSTSKKHNKQDRNSRKTVARPKSHQRHQTLPLQQQDMLERDYHSNNFEPDHGSNHKRQAPPKQTRHKSRPAMTMPPQHLPRTSPSPQLPHPWLVNGHQNLPFHEESWESFCVVTNISRTIDPDGLIVHLLWHDGSKTQHEPSVIYAKCPQQMLKFFENHLVFRATD